MADAVATQILFDGERKAIMKFTNISDGTGENKALKVDVSALLPDSFGQACNGVTITKIHASIHTYTVDLFWDATADVYIQTLTPNGMYTLDYTGEGGLWNDAGAGKTGDILLSTHQNAAGARYTIVLEMVKSYAGN
jgi:hypothetical protein